MPHRPVHLPDSAQHNIPTAPAFAGAAVVGEPQKARTHALSHLTALPLAPSTYNESRMPISHATKSPVTLFVTFSGRSDATVRLNDHMGAGDDNSSTILQARGTAQQA